MKDKGMADRTIATVIVPANISPKVSLRPGGSVGGPRPTVAHGPLAGLSAGATVLAKYATESRSWKRATVVEISSNGSVTVRFDGYADTTTVPIDRVKEGHCDDKRSRRGNHCGRRQGARPDAQRALQSVQVAMSVTQLPRASSPSDKILAAARCVLSKLAPANFDKLSEQVTSLPIDTPATLAALIDLMFERAIGESFFVSLYVRLLVSCTEAIKPCADPEDPTARPVSFRTLLLQRAQKEFEQEASSCVSSTDRKRTLGYMILLGQLWLKHLLRDQILHECVNKVLDVARADEGSAGEAIELHTDAIEAACTLLSTIGSSCDASTTGKARMDKYMAVLQGWAADKRKVPSARIRFKLLDTIEARANGWSVKAC